jgi:hypothetical protein
MSRVFVSEATGAVIYVFADAVIQKLVHHALERNVLQRRDTDQLHLAADLGKSHARNPALAAVSGMNVWWAVIGWCSRP